MSRIEGNIAGANLDHNTDKDLKLIGDDMKAIIAEPQATPQPLKLKSRHVICSTAGNSILGYRVNFTTTRTFRTEKEVTDFIHIPARPDLVRRYDHEIIFTHADLSMRNTMTQNGRVSGILNWENSDWYLQYWEYGKMYFCVRLNKRWMRTLDMNFDGRFAEELAIER